MSFDIISVKVNRGPSKTQALNGGQGRQDLTMQESTMHT